MMSLFDQATAVGAIIEVLPTCAGFLLVAMAFSQDLPEVKQTFS
jgi:uncharacterized membrane protein YbaN (DUF454 family)